ncbi:MAG: hypothetical protein K2W95_24800 [Candidatus Obscuribacterales bacterium]|nr:hypothetical protein [Candidatus Obscuribacterales bacterium]
MTENFSVNVLMFCGLIFIGMTSAWFCSVVSVRFVSGSGDLRAWRKSRIAEHALIQGSVLSFVLALVTGCVGLVVFSEVSLVALATALICFVARLSVNVVLAATEP